MRRVVLALVLLPAAALAQIRIGDEVVSNPMPAHRVPIPFGGPGVAMAGDAIGVAIAWSMPNANGVERIYVTRLDDAGHVAGDVRELPASEAQSNAVTPSIAANPSGSGFTVAWSEGSQAVYCRLDASLAPSALHTLMPVSSPPIVRSRPGADAVWLANAGSIWKIAPDGSRLVFVGINASDMTVATDFPQLVGGHSLQTNICTCVRLVPCRQLICETHYVVDYLAIYAATQSRELPFQNDALPAVGNDGKQLMVAWFDGAQTRGGNVVVARVPLSSLAQFQFAPPLKLGSFAYGDAGPTRPDIASDGERTVVVWRVKTTREDHDVAGAWLDRDGSVTPLTIATSTADERDPSVIAVGNGAFLVAYEKIEAGERRIAGRFVTLPGRQRAVR